MNKTCWLRLAGRQGPALPGVRSACITLVKENWMDVVSGQLSLAQRALLPDFDLLADAIITKQVSTNGGRGWLLQNGIETNRTGDGNDRFAHCPLRQIQYFSRALFGPLNRRWSIPVFINHRSSQLWRFRWRRFDDRIVQRNRVQNWGRVGNPADKVSLNTRRTQIDDRNRRPRH